MHLQNINISEEETVSLVVQPAGKIKNQSCSVSLLGRRYIAAYLLLLPIIIYLGSQNTNDLRSNDNQDYGVGDQSQYLERKAVGDQSQYLERKAAEPGFGSWLDGCECLYLDVGSNIGIQIRKLFEPELYPDAPALKLFNEYFGSDRKVRKDICAVGFEPNIHHTEQLKVLEDAYTAKGWRVKIFTETAAAAFDGTADFFFDKTAAPQQHEWGASLVAWQNEMKQNDTATKTTVRTMDLAKYILDHVTTREVTSSDIRKPTVIMKVDIEGAEHTIMPHLILTGALCQIDVLFAEWHGWGEIALPEGDQGVKDRTFFAFADEFIKKYENKDVCHTTSRQLDDESYGDSNFPLPVRRTLKLVHTRR